MVYESIFQLLHRNFTRALYAISLHEERAETGRALVTSVLLRHVVALGRFQRGIEGYSLLKSLEALGTAVSTQRASRRCCWGTILLREQEGSGEEEGEARQGTLVPEHMRGSFGWSSSDWGGWYLHQQMRVMIRGTWGINFTSLLNESMGWWDLRILRLK